MNISSYVMPKWYLLRNVDVYASECDPVDHFIEHGLAEGRDPNPMFDTAYYRETYPDVQDNWLHHYVHHGWREGRDPHNWFSVDYYLRENPDVRRSNVDPLLHYLQFGRDEGRIPSESHITPSKPIALLADEYCPDPARDAGSLYQLAFINIFEQLGFQIDHFALFENDERTTKPFRLATSYAETNVLRSPDFFSSFDDYLFRQGDHIKIAFLSRHTLTTALMERVRILCPNARIIFNTVDLHHLREQRHALAEHNVRMHEISIDSKRSEFKAISEADATLVSSSFELQYLRDRGYAATHIPLLQDFRYTKAPSFECKKGLGFIGEPVHRPNYDAITFFLSSVWPIIRRRRPELTFSIAGAGWGNEFNGTVPPGVILPGRIEQLSEFFDPIRLSIAPLRFGAGTKGKIVSSLGSGVPCIATSIAVEGMDLTHDDNIIVADSAANFANAVVNLHDDEAKWKQIAKSGLAFHKAHFSLSHGITLIQKLLGDMQIRTVPK